MRIVNLDRELLQMAVHLAADRAFIERCRSADFERLVLGHPGYAVIRGGELVGAGGVVMHWPGLAEGWLLPSIFATRRDLVRATRGMRQWFDRLQQEPVYRRLEIRISAAAAWRSCWAKAIGFDAGQLLEAWGPDGSDHFLHARIAKGAS
jgi:hypothetical protein